MNLCRQNMLTLWQIGKRSRLTNSLLLFNDDRISATEAISKTSTMKLPDSERSAVFLFVIIKIHEPIRFETQFEC